MRIQTDLGHNQISDRMRTWINETLFPSFDVKRSMWNAQWIFTSDSFQNKLCLQQRQRKKFRNKSKMRIKRRRVYIYVHDTQKNVISWLWWFTSKSFVRTFPIAHTNRMKTTTNTQMIFKVNDRLQMAWFWPFKYDTLDHLAMMTQLKTA